MEASVRIDRWVIARTQGRRALEQAPYVIAGLPVLILCLVAYAAIYENHFFPWDMMEETPSTDPTAAAIRTVLNYAWLVVLLLGALSAWRVVGGIRQGRYVLPAAFVLGLIVLISQADIFIERTTWFARGQLRASDVNFVSPYSVGLISLAVAIPAVFLVLDAWARRRLARAADSVNVNVNADSVAEGGGRNLDALAVGAVVAPCLAVVMPIAAITLFFLLTWAAASFRLRHKLAATVALALPLATAAVVDARPEGIDDPGIAGLGFLGLFIVVWAWLASVAWRQSTPPPALAASLR